MTSCLFQTLMGTHFHRDVLANRSSPYVWLSSTIDYAALVPVLFFRCYAIKYPLKARSVCTNSRAKKSVVLVWGLAMVLATPILYIQVMVKSLCMVKTQELRRLSLRTSKAVQEDSGQHFFFAKKKSGPSKGFSK